MELHQLRYLLAVVDEGSFTAAAEAVRISQSGVSTQVRKLERELGVTLLDRSARRVALTSAGEHMLPAVRSAVAALDAVGDTARALRGLVVGAVRVGTVTGLVWPPLFDALATVHAEHPGVDLQLSEGNSDDLVTGVRGGVLDVAVAAWAEEAPAGVKTAVLIEDTLVAVVSPAHPWAARSAVTAAQAARADVIALPRGTGARSAFDALLAREGMPQSAPRWEVSTPLSVQMLASRGIGVGIVSAATAEGWDGVVPIPVDDPRAASRLGLVWQERPSHAARAFLDELLSDVSSPT